jgi:hypothetical protein
LPRDGGDLFGRRIKIARRAVMLTEAQVCAKVSP